MKTIAFSPSAMRRKESLAIRAIAQRASAPAAGMSNARCFGLAFVAAFVIIGIIL